MNYIYPIKSLGGIQLPSAVLTDRGFTYDRRWMLVDAYNNFLSQRTVPQMALLQVQLSEDGFLVHHQHHRETLHVPFEPSGESCMVTVWDDVCSALYVSAEADEWFSRMLALPCRLVYMPDDSLRKVDPQYAQQEEITSFSDGYPLLLIGQASLDDLNSRLPQPIGMIRFRPNIVFTGGVPYQEDEMTAFDIAGVMFYGVKPCARCVITTIDPATGEKGKEPLRTLSSYRQRDKKIFFGQNLLPEKITRECSIAVGDRITLL